MYRRIAFAVASAVFVLPGSALASESGGASSAQAKAAIIIGNVKASKSGRTVTARVRWTGVPSVDPKTGGTRYTVRLVSGSAGKRRVVGTYSHRKTKRKSETVRFRLNSRNARAVRSSSRVFATATQQYDGPDNDRRFERNHVAIASMKGKRPFASAAASSCPKVITPGTDMTGCQIPGSFLVGADLSKVIFYQANLEVSNLAGADLSSTDLTQADLTGALLVGAKMNAGEQSALTFPDDGEQIGALIDGAKTSVDVIIYSFGGPNIVGQGADSVAGTPASPGALMRAVSRGVNVRVIVNSGDLDCASTTQDPDQSNCLGAPKLDGVYATEAALKWAAANPAPGVSKTGSYRVQFSSQNYQITHQKSILIDTSDKNGNPLSETDLQNVPSSQVLVSTGNLQSYGWGSYLKCSAKDADQNCIKYVVQNAEYLNNPAASCYGGPSKCAEEWAARDFAIKVTDPKLMARITAVYAADQTCKKWDEADVYGELLGSDLADTWANGTLQANGSQPPNSYPAQGTSAFYSGFGPNLQLQLASDGKSVVPQGNSRQRQLALINSAQKTLVVYNEEMDDPDILNALAAAARNGKDVRVVMSSPFYNGVPSPKGETDYTSSKTGELVKGNYKFSYLVSNGVRVRFFNSNQNANELYIHAKAIVADGVNAFMGSENFGYASMNYNRELGLMLTNSTRSSVVPKSPSVLSVGGVAAIMTAFSKDWNDPDAVAFQAATPPANEPYSGYFKADYPQPDSGLPFDNPEGSGKWTYNANCLPPVNGDLFEPKLPTRTPPPHS